MIKVTRLNGREFYINPHQIEVIEATPDTIIRLLTGQKYVVKETVEEVVEEVIKYRRDITAFSPFTKEINEIK
jgi:flagellar protein FlbD